MNQHEAIEALTLDQVQFDFSEGAKISYAFGNPPYMTVGAVNLGRIEGLLFKKIIDEMIDLKRQLSALKKQKVGV